ncbi:MAG: hypothetical protein KAQ98_10780 [Bacteriovoracaceae bacterium]|nr:hypothetical protein [Bacteriovoracaceae bacterium]
MMFGFFKKNTIDLVSEYYSVRLIHEFVNHPTISSSDIDNILFYIKDNRPEVVVVLSSLTEGIRIRQGSRISKEAFDQNLEFIHKLMWPTLVLGMKSGNSFRGVFDSFMEDHNKLAS